MKKNSEIVTLDSDRVIHECRLAFLEERFRSEINDAGRLAVLNAYALEALLVGRFWRLGFDGKPFAWVIFDSKTTAVQVGRHVFRVFSSMPGMVDTLDDQLGLAFADHWRTLVLDSMPLQPMPLQLH
ncbi:hypothetical protein [Bordetella sp. 15P40C-2]|uniref:hypothetical protein n=1 Tax=Bordetella sp. 15P40C-2 TaxID=2572246 RepID=UPI001323A8EB|nr:hypothetical protein [Bordetella sp. 15P40C-2]MVW72877.1 hypothetical protein [Bordetella sp. 15P40C-2]